MKPYRPLQVLFLLLCLTILVPPLTNAQSMCTSIITLKKGSLMEYSSFNKKDKFQGKQIIKVLDSKTTGGKTISTIEAIFEDKKGKETTRHTYEMTCEDDVLYVDLRNTLDPQLYQSMGSLEIEWSGMPNSYPSNLKVGQKIPDASIQMKARSGGMQIMDMTIDIVDQNVEAFENVNTSAGTFKCAKIASTTNVKAIIRRSFPSVVYFSSEVGAVKSESFDTKGRLTSYSLLTSYRIGG